VLAVQDNVTECWTGCTPVPVIEILIGEFVALLATAIVPENWVADVGVNLTAKVAVPPAAIESPEATPEVVYAAAPVPPIVTLETVTLELPAFVRVTFSELLLPRLTFPKVKLFVLALRMKVAATPVPESEIESGEVPLLLVREIEPFATPAEFGANITLKVVLPPAAIVAGSANPLIVKPVPVTVA